MILVGTGIIQVERKREVQTFSHAHNYLILFISLLNSNSSSRSFILKFISLVLPWLRSLSCLQPQRVLGVSHRFLTLVLDSRYHRLNSIPPEMSMASPPMNSALAVGPDCSWISWSHGKAQVTHCRPQRFPYSLWYCPHTTCHFAGTKRNRGIF